MQWRAKFPRSVAKYLRRQKAIFRRQFPSSAEADAKIRELVNELQTRYHVSVTSQLAGAAPATRRTLENSQKAKSS